MSDKPCRVDDCSKFTRVNGTLCTMHEARLRRHGTFESSRQCELSAAERFELYVQRGPGCWPWRGPRSAYGYGRLAVGGRRVPAHRFSYEHHKGPIPSGYSVMHSCDNPPCVNPDHLSAGTHTDNMRDKEAKGRGGGGARPGSGHHRARLTEPDVHAIRQAHATGRPHASLARQFGISESQVGRIVRRQSWVLI